MELINSLVKDIQTFFQLFGWMEMIVISVNVLLMILARRILHAFYHSSDTSSGFRYRVNIFRVFNILVLKVSRSMNISLATPVGVMHHNALLMPQGCV